jgi:hypothetical protein
MLREATLVRIRAAVLGANVLLAAGLPATVVCQMRWGGTEPPRGRDPAELRFDSVPRPSPESARRLAPVASWLQPGPTSAEDADRDEDAKEERRPPPVPPGGPLASEWEYAFYIIDRTDARRSLVMLRRREETPPRGPAARVRPTFRSAGSTRRSGGRAIPVARQERTLVFSVGERRIRAVVGDAMPLDFVVQSADTERLIYLLPTDPGTTYSLPFSGRRFRGLDPTGSASGETDAVVVAAGGPSEEPAAPRPAIAVVRKEREERIEREYERWKAGAPDAAPPTP